MQYNQQLPGGTEPTLGEGGKKRSEWRDLFTLLGILVTAFLLAVVLIMFVFRSYAVDGPSMETTLKHQDKLIIWKLPRTVARITGNQYIPGRGDVVVFSQANLTSCGQGDERQLIKRVIALPGERVIVKDGAYTVYNAEHVNGFDPDQTLDYNKDGRIPETTGDLDILLDKNELFVTGDNRPNSCDSRNFGPIRSDQIIGKLILRLLPANQIKVF